jgi:DNA-binding GntR family transcriptional regulator/DNA-binding LacI/PurR family transcriptional regulator
MNAIQHAYTIIKTRLETGESGPGDRLPSLTDLAKTCSVSRTTMWRALILLQKESLLHARRGGAIIAGPPGTPQIATTPKGLLWERLKEQIKTDLVVAEYSENGLPIVSTLALRYRVTPRTIKKALTGLVREGFLAANGRRYCFAKSKQRKYQPVIFLISEGSKEQGIFQLDFRTQSVFESFERESLRLGFAGRAEGFATFSPTALVDLVSAIGAVQNVAGCIVNIWNPWDAVFWQRWIDLLNFLAARNAPVTVIDQAGNLQFPQTLLRQPFFRVLRIASESAGEEAADFLFHRGHKRPAYVSPFFGQKWAKSRYTGLCRFWQRQASNKEKVELFALSEIADQEDLVLGLLNPSPDNVKALYPTRFSKDKIAGLIEKLNLIHRNKMANKIGGNPVGRTLRPVAETIVSLTKKRYDPATFMAIQQALLSIAGDKALGAYLQPFFHRILVNSHADTWVCSDAETALAAMAFLKSHHKKVPDDIAVFSFQNSHAAYEQQLSLYDFNMNGIVQQAMRMIMDEKALKSRPTISEVDGYIVERRTTRRKKQVSFDNYPAL